MDPISAALAGLALATALKDVIELAQKLSDSLVKVAKNMTKSRRLASDIVNSLRQLEKVYERYSQTLAKSHELKDAVDHLRSELQGVYQRCHGLFEPNPKSRLKRARVAFNAWMNAGEVEEEIAVLKDHVNACHIRFTTFAAARIEGKTREIHDATSRLEVTTTRIEQLLVFDNGQAAELRQMEGMITSLKKTEPASFYTSAPSSEAATRSAISDTYLRFQVEAIDQSLVELAANDQTYPIDAPLEGYLRPFKSVIRTRVSQDRESRHREVVQTALSILQTLQQDSSSLSIQEGAWDMVNLAISLHHLQLFHEAATIGQWTVNLFRTLASVEPEIYRPYLTLALVNLTRYYLETSPEKAPSTMEEALFLSRILQSTSKSPEIRSQLGRSLTTYASMLAFSKDYDGSFAAAHEAVAIFEANLQELKQWSDTLSSPASPNGSILSSQPSIDSTALSEATCVDADQASDEEDISGYDRVIYDHARALIQVANNLEDTGRLVEAHEVSRRILDSFRHLHSIYPGSVLDDDYASWLYSLGRSIYRDIIPNDEAITYLDEAVLIYRKLYKCDPKKYAQPLYDALWQQASVLGGLQRLEEAHEAWLEAVDVAKRLMSDQLFLADALIQASGSLRRLKRYDDAAVLRLESVQTYHSVLKKANEFEADACHELAIDYQLAERHREAIRPAEDAVVQYRALAFEDPVKFTAKLANGLGTLANVFLGAEEREDLGLERAIECVTLFEDLVKDDPSRAPQYIRALRIMRSSAYRHPDADKAIAKSLEVVVKMEDLATKFPDEIGWNVADAMEHHGLLLCKSNRWEDAILWEEKNIQWFENLPVDNAEAVEKYLVCLINNCSDLNSIGRTEQSLAPIQKAIELGKKFCDANASVASYTASSLLRYAHVLWELGRHPESLVASAESVEFVRSTTVTDITEYAGCLVIHAMALEYNGRTSEAVAVAQEAVDICRNADMVKISHFNSFAFLQLPRALEALSQALADNGDDARSHSIAQEGLDECLKLKAHEKKLPWTLAEGAYGGALHNLATQLFVAGDIDRSLQLFAEAKAFQTKRSQVRHGAFVELACVVRISGICYCFAGRHEEGVAAQAELESLLRRLKIAFPDLYRGAVTALQREEKRPMRIRLLQKRRLACDHQSMDVRG